MPQLQSLGAALVAVSPQLAEHSRAVRKDKQLSFALLSDPGNEVAALYGVRFALPEAERNSYRSLGLDLPLFNGDDSWTLPLPSRFVIDPQGVIRSAVIQTDHTIRPDPQSVQAVLGELQ